MDSKKNKSTGDVTEENLHAYTTDQLLEYGIAMLKQSKVLEKDVEGYKNDAQRLRQERNALKEEVTELREQVTFLSSDRLRLIDENSSWREKNKDQQRQLLDSEKAGQAFVNGALQSSSTATASSNGKLSSAKRRRCRDVDAESISPTSSNSPRVDKPRRSRPFLPPFDANDLKRTRSPAPSEPPPPPPPPLPTFLPQPTCPPQDLNMSDWAFQMPSSSQVQHSSLPYMQATSAVAGIVPSSVRLGTLNAAPPPPPPPPPPPSLTDASSSKLTFGGGPAPLMANYPTSMPNFNSNAAGWNRMFDQNSSRAGGDFSGDRNRRSGGGGHSAAGFHHDAPSAQVAWFDTQDNPSQGPSTIPLIAGRIFGPGALTRNAALKRAAEIRSAAYAWNISPEQLARTAPFQRAFCKSCSAIKQSPYDVASHALSQEHLDRLYLSNMCVMAADFDFWEDLLQMSHLLKSNQVAQRPPSLFATSFSARNF